MEQREQHTGGHRDIGDTDQRKARGAQDTRHMVYGAWAQVVQGTHQHQGKGQRASQAPDIPATGTAHAGHRLTPGSLGTCTSRTGH